MRSILPILVHDFTERLSATESTLVHMSATLLLLAAIFSLAVARRPKSKALNTTSHIAGALALVLNIAYFVVRMGSTGSEFLASYFDAMQLAVSVTLFLYFVTLYFRRGSLLSAWVFPISLGLVLLSLFFGGGEVSSTQEEDLSTKGLIHISLAVVALALFAHATMLALAFLLQDKSLKKRETTRLLEKLPPIEHLGRRMRFSLVVGWIVLTFSLAIGFGIVWDNLSAWVQRPVILSSLVLWGIFAVATIGMLSHRISNRTTVFLVLVGFVLIVLTFVVSGVFFEQGHGPA